MDLDGPQKPYIEWGLDLSVDRVLFWGVILGLACIRYTECCQHLAMHLLLPLKFFCNAVCFPSLIKDNFQQVASVAVWFCEQVVCGDLEQGSELHWDSVHGGRQLASDETGQRWILHTRQSVHECQPLHCTSQRVCCHWQVSAHLLDDCDILIPHR